MIQMRRPANATRTAHSLVVVALLSTVTGRAHAQSVQGSPPVRIFVEGFRATDFLSRQAVVRLRAALVARTDPTVLQVITTATIDSTRAASRDDVGSPLSWGRVREFARQLGAQHIIDLSAARDSGTVRIVAYVVHPVRTGEPMPMPVITGRSVDAAVMKLADHLAARNWAIAK